MPSLVYPHLLPFPGERSHMLDFGNNKARRRGPMVLRIRRAGSFYPVAAFGGVVCATAAGMAAGGIWDVGVSLGLRRRKIWSWRSWGKAKSQASHTGSFWHVSSTTSCYCKSNECMMLRAQCCRPWAFPRASLATSSSIPFGPGVDV
ncbi:uncharacterized protein BDR25DRAFT_87831 [Lindgomyces ingoldianus]|uniref:Uncharacterized protein n=1 Tax=Lindgomyces ingoldianus TaxID=673940 RepID=A0ACB6R8V6_9PLEO|nr:uncharacterized protein BDR25DRAFT_87831 [Lindgomyces ingoldianus]KAF2475689.1 hypothetical protein BDR25DRAFT_87831 [Lindgomyces ingoldianus]